MSDYDSLTGETPEFYEKVYDACNIYASTGRPADRQKKIKFTHVNNSFNSIIVLDFLVVQVKKENYHVIKTEGLEISYGKGEIVNHHCTDTIRTKLETKWIHRRVAPLSLTAEP